MKTIKAIFVILATAAPILTVQADPQAGVPTRLNEATIAQLQAEMASGKLTSVELTNYYLARIRALDQGAEGVNSIIELNPDALEMARTRRPAAPPRYSARASAWDPGAAQRQYRYRR